MSAGLFHIIVIASAAIAIGAGVIFPALGQTRAGIRAMDAIARQPDQEGVISRNLFIGLAMIESQALYVLIVSLILLFADPLEDRLDEAVSTSSISVWFLAASVASAALAITVGTMLSSLGQGKVTGAALDAVAEQPAAGNRLSTVLFITLALLESLALYALIVALILLFANPLIDDVLAL